MRTVVSSQWSVVSWRRYAIVGLLFAACCTLSCSIPNLESQECIDSRNQLKEFYSWYFGTSADERQNQKEVFKKYVSSSFKPFMRSENDWEKDTFTLTVNFPTTFRIAKCSTEQPDLAAFDVQLQWRPGEKSELGQTFKVIRLTMVKEENTWKIQEVRPALD